MKKYFGKKDWSESLYYIGDIEYFDEQTEECGVFEMNAFQYGLGFDWFRFVGFDDKNLFNDTNTFITMQEKVNAYQYGKI